MSPQTKNILSLAWPIMVENATQMLMTISDSYLVAQISLVAVSGIALAGNILAIYQAIFMALSAAISSLVAKNQVQRSEQTLAQETAQTIQLTIYLGLVMGLLAIFGGQSLLKQLGAEPEVSQVGGLYLAWVGGSVVCLGLMTNLSAILRAIGRPRQPLFVALLVNLLNLVLSAIAIFYFQLGTLGAALGTVLARLIGLALIWHYIPLRLKELPWSLKPSKELLDLALPSAAERLMMRSGDVIIAAFTTSLGTTVLAGNAIGETFEKLYYLPALSIASATIILIAQAKGHGDWQSIQAIRHSSYRLSFLMVSLLAISLVLISPWLLPHYTQSPVAMKASQTILVMALIGLPQSTGALIYTAIWQGMGRAKLPFYATTLGMWLIRICLAYLLVFQAKWGLVGICLATILDNSFRYLILRSTFTKTYRNYANEI